MRERQVGFVFQHYALFRHMTVFENVAFGLRVQAAQAAPVRGRDPAPGAWSCSSWCSSTGWPTAIPPQLSGGQRQRVALARALAVEPRVLLLDEPFGALDAKVRKELRRWLRRLHDELHITSVFVTHDQEEALEVADRVVVMNHGRVEQVGTPHEVYERPATPFVYGFLGAVNRFSGQLDGADTLRVGADRLAHDTPGLAAGVPALGFARPHELEIVVDGARDSLGVEAQVTRVLGFGANPRVELTGADGQHYEVELSRERIAALGLRPAQAVRLLPSRLSVFADTRRHAA